MPVSTGSLGEPRAKRCRLCDESSHRSESGSGFWQLQLDRDLIDTISAIYPEWFKSNMAEEGSPPRPPRESPPKAIIDTSPISIDQNKESLKVKLLLRRPFDQLVAQGIMPPHKTPAAYHGQRRQLERAKTGDVLKAKIQQRPPRQELERRHILEADPGHVDPSLAERQRMLKKARLADQLNDQLSHRPGPLELIQKNILHTEETIEQAVKTGRIPYKATSEGQLNRPQHPQAYINPEDDSQSSEGDNIVSPGPSDVLETAAKSAGIVVSLIPTEGAVVVATPVVKDKDKSEIVIANLCGPVTSATPLLSQVSASSPASLLSSASTLSPLSSVASPVPSIVSQPATPVPVPPPPPITLSRVLASQVKSDAPGKDKNRKKSKSKSTQKTRTIKFHEYKGPPSAQKSSNTTSNAGESSYDLLLKQQTLLLQFQLQLQHKYPQIILPASQKIPQQATETNNNINTQQPSPAPSTSSESSVLTKIHCRLEDMKVSDLKAELKRRSLPVSGSKPQLIERLKPFTNSSDLINQTATSIDSSVHSTSSMDHSHCSPTYQETGSPNGSTKDDQMEICDPVSPQPQIKESYIQIQPEIITKSNEEIVREQQRQIEALRRQLQMSQMQLHAVQTRTTSEPKAQLLALQKHLQQKQQQQNLANQMKQLHDLQAKQPKVNEERQRIQQEQHVEFQNQKNMLGGLVVKSSNQLLQNKTKPINGHNRTQSLPSSIVTSVEPPTKGKEDVKVAITIEDVKPPPLYREATKELKKSHVKSQIVDDVLEILIKNGELPPSAANDPSTPSTAGSTKVIEPPVFPIVNLTNEKLQSHDVITPEALEVDPADLLDSLATLDSMDFNQLVMDLSVCHQNNNNSSMGEQEPIPMDTDDWLESLLPSEPFNGNGLNNSTSILPAQDDISNYDPLLGIAHDTFDPFNLDELRSSAEINTLSWDELDFPA